MAVLPELLLELWEAAASSHQAGRPRHGHAVHLQGKHIIDLAGALAARGAVVPAFSLMIQMPTPGAAVLLDHAGREGVVFWKPAMNSSGS